MTDKTDKPKDVFAEAVALSLKHFPPRIVTITQSKADFELSAAELEKQAVPADDSSSLWPDLFLPDREAKPFDLSRLDPFTTMVLSPRMGPRPDADYFRIAQLADGLNGKEFAMLSEDELQRFRQLQREGRKFGLCVWVEVINDGDDVQAELAAASPAQKEEIYRRLRTEIAVRWAVLDSDPRRGLTE